MDDARFEAIKSAFGGVFYTRPLRREELDEVKLIYAEVFKDPACTSNEQRLRDTTKAAIDKVDRLRCPK